MILRKLGTEKEQANSTFIALRTENHWPIKLCKQIIKEKHDSRAAIKSYKRIATHYRRRRTVRRITSLLEVKGRN